MVGSSSRVFVRKNILPSLSSRLFWSTSSSQFLRTSIGPVKKGDVSPRLTVGKEIRLPEYALSGNPDNTSNVLALYSKEEIPPIRKAARLARKMLEFAKSLAKPGITTDEIDKLTHDEILRNGAYPTPLNYHGFPKSICTSVNEVACHGVPDSRPLMDGDLLSIDVSLYLNGFHGDNCGVVGVGLVSDQNQLLIDATLEAIHAAIDICKPGA